MEQYCYNCMSLVGQGSTFCRYCGKNLSESSDMSPYQLKPGTVLQNRYLIGSVLGEGGFGITYIGLDKVLAKRVAVKEFYPAGAAHRASVVSGDVIITRGKEPMYRRGVERFVQEARSLAAFSSEDGIVDVLDTFQANNTAYIVMEYLEGNTLKALLKTEDVFDAARLIKLMEPVMKSLSVMHRTGFIHRDISPDNIMLTNNGKLKLMDFGSARYFLNQDSELSVMLKQGYAPVEQYSSRSQQGPYTDVYALCATIYTCITGTVPENSLDRSRYDTLVPPSAKGVRISPVHEKALLHGLQPNAAVRSPDMETLMREFNGTVDPNRTQNAEVETNNGGGYIPPVPPEPPDTPPKNNTPIVVALVIATVAVLIVCGVLLFMLLKDNGGDDTETGTSTLASESTAMTVSSVETTVEPTTIIPTTIEPTTVVPTTIVPTTIVPTTIVPTPQPTSPPPPPQTSGWSEERVKDYIEDYIVWRWNEADDRMSQARSGSSYDYVVCDDNRLWIGTKGSFHDDDEDKIWYFYDENHQLYFIYRHSNYNEYRYYVCNNEVIKLTVGSTGDQMHYYYGSSQTKDSTCQSLIAGAYYALGTI
ncbi:MAG: serine/threonine protein kinase [Ruminococcus sp.]|nr:serine/threonine protein kinase [Ruminococcus sp.]